MTRSPHRQPGKLGRKAQVPAVTVDVDGVRHQAAKVDTAPAVSNLDEQLALELVQGLVRSSDRTRGRSGCAASGISDLAADRCRNVTRLHRCAKCGAARPRNRSHPSGNAHSKVVGSRYIGSIPASEGGWLQAFETSAEWPDDSGAATEPRHSPESHRAPPCSRPARCN